MPTPRLGLGHGAGRGLRLGRAVGQLRQAAVRGSVRAGDPATRRTASWSRPPSRGCGQSRAPSCATYPGFARALHAATAAPRRRARNSSPRRRRTRSSASRETKGEAFYRGDLAEKMVAHCAAARRRAVAGRPCDAHGGLGRAARPGLSRLHAARDPAQRPRHRRADGARHPRETSTWQRCRSIRPTACICRSRR